MICNSRQIFWVHFIALIIREVAGVHGQNLNVSGSNVDTSGTSRDDEKELVLEPKRTSKPQLHMQEGPIFVQLPAIINGEQLASIIPAKKKTSSTEATKSEEDLPVYPKWYLERQEEIEKSRAITISLMLGLSGFILLIVISVQSGLFIQKYVRHRMQKQLEMQLELDKLGEKMKIPDDIHGISINLEPDPFVKGKGKKIDEDVKLGIKSHHQIHLGELVLAWCRLLLKPRVGPSPDISSV